MRVVLEGSQAHCIDRAMALFELAVKGFQWGDDVTFDVRFGGSLDHTRIRAQLAAAKRRGAQQEKEGK